MRRENNIEGKEWKNYFKELLGGTEEKEEDENGNRQKGGGEEFKGQAVQQLEEKEIWDAVKRMKKKKAVGIDEIPMEAWMYGGNEIRRGLVDILKQI